MSDFYCKSTGGHTWSDCADEGQVATAECCANCGAHRKKEQPQEEWEKGFDALTDSIYGYIHQKRQKEIKKFIESKLQEAYERGVKDALPFGVPDPHKEGYLAGREDGRKEALNKVIGLLGAYDGFEMARTREEVLKDLRDTK